MVEDKCSADACTEGQYEECISEDVRARCECSLGYMGYKCEMDIGQFLSHLKKGNISSPVNL